jgi:uncharacterized membrane protein
MDTDAVVLLSGVAEITLGASLVFLHQKRILFGWLAAAFFVMIFPGNIAQWMYHRNAFGLNTDLAREIRLIFQPLLVAWALWSTGAWQQWHNRKRQQ